MLAKVKCPHVAVPEAAVRLFLRVSSTGRSDVSSVLLQTTAVDDVAVAAVLPIVTVDSSSTFPGTGRAKLSGRVAWPVSAFNSTEVTLRWSVDVPMDLDSIAISPVSTSATQVRGESTWTVDLVLPVAALPLRSSYVFSLAVYANNNREVASSSISIHRNSAPNPGNYSNLHYH